MEHRLIGPENETLTDMLLLYAAKDADGGRAALESFKACLKLRLSKQEVTITFSEQVDWFLNETNMLADFLSTALQKARILKTSPPNYLIGVELMDVVNQKCKFGAKIVELKKPQPWSQFSEEGCLVLFCRNIGQAIIPANSEPLCRSWRRVPESQSFLVVIARGIHNYLEERGGRILSFKLLWDFADSLIQTHTVGQRQRIKHTQTLHRFSPTSDMLGHPETPSA
jgi:hypothetical protein